MPGWSSIPRTTVVDAMHTDGHARGVLACWPRPYPENPYLGRLTAALGSRGIRVVAHRNLPLFASAMLASRTPPAWLHLHWPEWMTRAPGRTSSIARAWALSALLDALRSRGVRIAWTAHNLLGHDDPHRDLAWNARRALLQRCDVVFGHFPSAEHDVRGLGFRGTFAVTPHGHLIDDLPATIPRMLARQALGYPSGTTVLLALGTMERYKGMNDLAAAFVRHAPSHARLLIAGRAADERTLADVVRAARGDARVRIEPGFVPPSRANMMCAAADVAAMSYRQFYTSGSAMLALSAGLPVAGPCQNHLATLRERSFFVPFERVDDVGSVIQRATNMRDDVRADARSWSLAQTWDVPARVIDTTLFGARS